MCKNLNYKELEDSHLSYFSYGPISMFQHIISYLIFKKDKEAIDELSNKIINEFNFDKKKTKELEDFIKNRWYN
jgi:hypothetical protein